MPTAPQSTKDLANELGYDLSQFTLQVQSSATLYSGAGAPGSGVGQNGDWYFRTDTPGTANQRLYIKASGSWSGVV